MAAPREVLELIERFRSQYESYKSPDYKEFSLRREFVDPFFKALGWDVDNTQGYAEAYKDVIHEDSIKVGGVTKAPDYCFRVGGVRKFFVETKKPSVNISQDTSAAFQLRRYAWSAKLPLSILTDFEEFAVYDCRIPPAKTDKPGIARTLHLRYEDYDDKWDQIAGLFSREAILKGAFDRYAESTRKKRGTAEVDELFLDEIEEWRTVLAKNIALRNELSQRDVNAAVQKTIDRIVFLRICEDRGIEHYGQLQGLLNGAGIYKRLGQLFERADERYNSGLFHFYEEKNRSEPPDEWTLNLAIDDKPLRDIIRRLYYPDSPYEFSVLGADILGQVYEQFLGKVIRLTAGGRAVVEDKPEAKKAGGVYYTPTYIVDYIVANTVGKLVKGKTPHDVAGRTATFKPKKGARPLAILDPACGSGSFLIGAYQFLLDWYRDRYLEDGPAKHKDRIYQTRKDAWRLSTVERKRILLDHIYGVDIDPQAVEVTKLSLLLKVLEGENEETLAKQLRLFKERALPDLGNNIKCGNSLIGPNFYHGRQRELFDEEEMLRINAFDWQAEFPHVFPTRARKAAKGEAGGFDAVIGNPPYVRMEMFKEIKDYLRAKYASHAERTDLYVYFIEREHQLLRRDGWFGMIVSNKFIRANYGEPIRRQLREVAGIAQIVDLAGLPVFRGATVRTVVVISRRAATAPSIDGVVMYSPPPPLDVFRMIEGGTKPLDEVADETSYPVSHSRLEATGWCLLRPEHAEIMDRLQDAGTPLKTFTAGRICRGIVSGLTAAFVIDAATRRHILASNPAAEKIIRPFLQGRNVRRYSVEPSGEYLIYTHHGIDMTPYPAVIEHLRPFKRRLENRATRQNWYELQQPQFAYVDFLERPKIVFPDIATEPRFALDTGGHFGANTVYFIPTSDPALLALLNSRLAHFYFIQTCAALEGPGEKYLRFFGQYLEGFPVCLDKAPTTTHKKLAELGTHTTDLHGRLHKARRSHERTAFERRIRATDMEIDRLVYELYALTDDEIRIVENEKRDRSNY